MNSRRKHNHGGASAKGGRKPAGTDEIAAWIATLPAQERNILIPLEFIRGELRHPYCFSYYSHRYMLFRILNEIGIPLLEISLILLVKSATRAIDRIRHHLKRPIYYNAENARRRALAAERRKIARRTTSSPRPTREALLEAWRHRKESPENAIRFGSMIHDLECYLDNSLRFNEAGDITGRNGGIKRWLEENLPELFKRYSSVMRYKAAAKKLKQLAKIDDPTPAAEIFAERENPETEIVRARAIWNEIAASSNANPTSVFARIDALLDPENITESTMLESWRRKYANEITLRTKLKWWKRFSPPDGRRRERRSS